MREVKSALKDAKAALGTAKAQLAKAEQVVEAKPAGEEATDVSSTKALLPSSDPPAPMPPAVLVEEEGLEQADGCPPLTGETRGIPPTGDEKASKKPSPSQPPPRRKHDQAAEDASEDEEMEHVEVDPRQVGVQLGFLEPLGDCPVEEAHHPAYFPSKVGGKPVWLDPRKPAHPGDVQCKNCKKPLQFLLQWYSSYEMAPHDEAFHRTLYLYICRDPKCIHHNTAVVIRQQLGRENPFYLDDSEPEGVDMKDLGLIRLPKSCVLCGSAAPSRCSRCKAVSYCSKEHQREHWALGHKGCCLPDGESVDVEKWEYNLGVLNQAIDEWHFPIVDLVSEPEPGPKPLSKDEQRKYNELVSNFKKGEKRRKGAAKKKALEAKDEDLEDLRDVLNPVDNYWDEFIDRIKREPGQCIRSLDLEKRFADRPLWPCERLRAEYVPPCEGCGRERRWEIQVLPQFIYQIKEQKLDWNSIVIYSCPDSCTKSKQEFAHVQAIVRQHDLPSALLKKVVKE